MNRPGSIKSVLLLISIGVIVLASVEPIAGQTMGEHSANGNDHAQMFAEAKRIIDTHVSCDKLTDDQFEALGDYYMEQMHPGEAHERMDRMMSNMMGEEGLRQMHINMGKRMYCGMGGGMMGGGMMGGGMMGGGMMGGGMMGGGMMGGGMMGGHIANETIVQPISGNQSANETIVQPISGNQSANETMMYCVTDNLSANETIMYCIMGNYSANTNITQQIEGNYSANNNTMHDMLMYCVKGESPTSGSCYVISVDQNITNPTLARLDCARFWLQQAIDLHKVHLKDPSTATNESQMLMMDQMMRAYDCLTETNMTAGIANTTGGNVS